MDVDSRPRGDGGDGRDGGRLELTPDPLSGSADPLAALLLTADDDLLLCAGLHGEFWYADDEVHLDAEIPFTKLHAHLRVGLLEPACHGGFVARLRPQFGAIGGFHFERDLLRVVDLNQAQDGFSPVEVRLDGEGHIWLPATLNALVGNHDAALHLELDAESWGRGGQQRLSKHWQSAKLQGVLWSNVCVVHRNLVCRRARALVHVGGRLESLWRERVRGEGDGVLELPDGRRDLDSLTGVPASQHDHLLLHVLRICVHARVRGEQLRCQCGQPLSKAPHHVLGHSCLGNLLGLLLRLGDLLQEVSLSLLLVCSRLSQAGLCLLL